MVTINIDNLDEYNIKDLEKALGKTVEQAQRMIFGELNYRVDDNDRFIYNEIRACKLSCVNKSMYFITEHGDIYREFDNGNIRCVNKKYVQNQWTVVLCDGKNVSRYTVGILIAKCFVENPYNYKYIKYIDGDNNNLRADNIEWVKNTPKRHYIKANTVQIDMLDKSGNLVESFDKMKDCCDKYNFKSSNICAVLKGRCETAYGYKFRYRQ